MDWIKKHFVIVLILIIVVVIGVWYGMSGGGAAPTSNLTTETVGDTGSPTADEQDRDLVETLLTLRAITLSGTIFTDPAFKSLQDFGTTIIPEPVGRDNPFAPYRGQYIPPDPNAPQTGQVKLQRTTTPSTQTSGR